MKNPVMFSLVLIVMAAVACKKDDNKKNPEEQAVQLITSASWKIDTIGLDTDDNNEIDTELPFDLLACEKDDILTFYADSTGVYGEGASKCNVSDPDDTPFNWSFKSGGTVIDIEGELNELLTGDITVIALTETSLKVAKPVSIPFFPSSTRVVGHFKK